MYMCIDSVLVERYTSVSLLLAEPVPHDCSPGARSCNSGHEAHTFVGAANLHAWGGANAPSWTFFNL